MGESWSGGVVFFNANNGAKNYVYHLHQLVESGLAVGQADDDRPLEVYVLRGRLPPAQAATRFYRLTPD